MTGAVPMSTPEELYRQALASPSDINEHLPTLYALARECAHVTEMGTRSGCSTRAFLHAQPEALVCYDLERRPEVDPLEEAARQAGRPRFRFHQADVLQVEIEETDLLFIDTFHVYEQTRQELARHAGKVRKYLVFHDTTTFGDCGQEPGSRGIWPAIEEFLRDNSGWQLVARHTQNNGLTVLRRAAAAGQNRPAEPCRVGAPVRGRRVYDCFPFFNELELLEIRLHELDEVADRFVLVESTRTHSGWHKPLHYHQHRRRFARWSSRIIHVVVDDMPAGSEHWDRERWQRQSIGRGLSEACPDDVILVSDVDEIPRAVKVREHRDTPEVKLFQQQLSYGFLNNVTDELWFGTRMLSYADFCRLGGAQAIRGLEGIAVPDGGWHFSYMGGVGRIRAKLQAYAHQEYSTGHFSDPAHLGQALRAGADLLGRDVRCRLSTGDDLPQYVLDHRRRFSDWIWDEPFSPEEPGAPSWLSPLSELCHQVRPFTGDLVVLGCADTGRVIAMANACCPEPLWAVDEWPEYAPSTAGSPPAPQPPEPYAAFLRALRVFSPGNVHPVLLDPVCFLQGHRPRIKLCCLDPSRFRGHLADVLPLILTRLAPGGIVCGLSSNPPPAASERTLAGLLPGCRHAGELWWWQSPQTAHHPLRQTVDGTRHTDCFTCLPAAAPGARADAGVPPCSGEGMG
jgi:beta-1,4-mannosyl-glycoprotein beta-1,4-N-acetylglucosaminyltransferase